MAAAHINFQAEQLPQEYMTCTSIREVKSLNYWELSDDVGLSVDYWTSCATENYLGVTVHLINSLGTKYVGELLSLASDVYVAR